MLYIAIIFMSGNRMLIMFKYVYALYIIGTDINVVYNQEYNYTIGINSVLYLLQHISPHA